MRKFFLVGGGALIATALIAAGASAHTTKFSVITLNQSAHPSGDGVIIHGKIVDPSDRHEVIGHDRAHFSPNGDRVRARIRFHFEDGSELRVKGGFGPGDNKLAVAGGSGVFEDADGVVRLHDAGEGAERYAFRLTGP